MKNLLIVTIGFLYLLAAQSCKKERIDRQEIESCHAAQNYDSARLAEKLVGTWKWTKRYCYWTRKTVRADKDVKVIFEPTGSFSITENAVVISQGNWELEFYNNLFYLDVDVFTEGYLIGEVLLCENQVLFNGSDADGCDNLFVRIN